MDEWSYGGSKVEKKFIADQHRLGHIVSQLNFTFNVSVNLLITNVAVLDAETIYGEST